MMVIVLSLSIIMTVLTFVHVMAWLRATSTVPAIVVVPLAFS